ncbi:TIGR03503 family protein [Vibrio sp. V03_P4A6T147]|uniref:TIGR03503 family protein n=1 Tax=Vibrio sp. V03_P4A6T147 TaxID=1938658 RepID=UPI000B9F20CE|nr:TIGR03503 family protein [Vibrio sp. V03_P4A6T147]
MLRIMVAIAALMWSIGVFAANPSSMSLLDNRFRVDPTISQITFVVYREKSSQPVVLVRPDGKKYYAWRYDENMRWYQEPTMDIISIDKPMPGPWQAIGKVSPQNSIKLISHLQLDTDVFPSRLYHGEELKFTARLTSDGKPLLLRDFLDRVNLKVTFTKFVENEEELIKEARPLPEVIGEFADDGRGLDEQPGDGIFTVALPITPMPGKYRVRITSGNGVFLRAQEQEVLVYPAPVSTTFIQSRVDGAPHQIVFSGEQGMIAPGSIVAHVEHANIYDDIFITEGQSEKEALKLSLEIPYNGDNGNYRWSGKLYATELASQRPLYFPLAEHTYSVVDDVNIEETRRLQMEEEIQQRKLEQEQLIIQMREEATSRSIMFIVIGNIGAILIGLLAWFVMRKIKAKKALQPELQLNMPKK